MKALDSIWEISVETVGEISVKDFQWSPSSGWTIKVEGNGGAPLTPLLLGINGIDKIVEEADDGSILDRPPQPAPQDRLPNCRDVAQRNIMIWLTEDALSQTPDSPPDMVGSCLVCFQGVSGCRPGVTHDTIGHRTGSRVPSLRVSAAVRCQLWLFSGQRRHGRAWQLGRVAYKPMLQAGSPMLDAARQPAPISSAAP